MMALRRDDQGLSDFVQHISNYGTDVQIAAFECIPEAWKHGGSLSALLKINSTALCLSSHTLRVVAYHNVSELLENLSAPPTEWKQILRDLLETADQFSTVSFLEQQQGTSGQAEACCKIKLGAWVSVAAFYHYAEGDPDFAEFKQHPFTIWSHWLTHGLGAYNVSPLIKWKFLKSFAVANFYRISIFVLHVLAHFVYSTRSRMGMISRTGKRLSHLFWLYIML
jgi:hypothetical protein